MAYGKAQDRREVKASNETVSQTTQMMPTQNSREKKPEKKKGLNSEKSGAGKEDG